MIIRKGGTWTTIQCPTCNYCFKVLNNKFRLNIQCPYCDNTVAVKVYKEQAAGSNGALNVSVGG